MLPSSCESCTAPPSLPPSKPDRTAAAPAGPVSALSTHSPTAHTHAPTSVTHLCVAVTDVCHIVHAVQVLPPLLIKQIAALAPLHQQGGFVAEGHVGPHVLPALLQGVCKARTTGSADITA